MHTRLPGEIFTAVVVNSNVTSLSVKVRSKINILRLESSEGENFRRKRTRENSSAGERINDRTDGAPIRREARNRPTFNDPRSRRLLRLN